MEDDPLLTLNGIAEVRSATERAFMRTVLFHSAIGLLAGVAFAALGYFGNWMRTGDPTLTVVFGIGGIALAAPKIVHWVRHFGSVLGQLDQYEARVRRGESILASSVRFHSYREFLTVDAQRDHEV